MLLLRMFNPVQLNLPPYPFRIKEESGATFIFDDIRKKFLVLTPEEWVRQHFVKFLIVQKKYPKGLIGLEGGIKLHTLQKRCDIILYNSSGEKIMLVECKAPSVKISQAVFDQVARYNMVHQVSLLAVTNGLQHYFCTINTADKTYRFIEDLPEYG